jgi:hypothetical protein
MRYIVGVILLLVVVCTISVFFVEEGFDNVGGKTAADYYRGVMGQMGSSYTIPDTTEYAKTTKTLSLTDPVYLAHLQTVARELGIDSTLTPEIYAALSELSAKRATSANAYTMQQTSGSAASSTNNASQSDLSYYNLQLKRIGEMYRTTSPSSITDANYKIWLQTNAPYVGLQSSGEATPVKPSTPSTSNNSDLDILAALVKLQKSSATATSSNAKPVPGGYDSTQSSPGSADQVSATNTPALTQGQTFKISYVPGKVPTIISVPETVPIMSAIPSQSSPGSTQEMAVTNTPALTQGQTFTISYVPGKVPTISGVSGNVPTSTSCDDGEEVAVKVNKQKEKQCPDMSQYVRKDSIPCWGCKL